MEYTTYYYDGGYQIFTPQLINNIKSAKLRYFDKKGNLEHQEDLHGVSNTEYFYSYDDTVAYNYKGKVVGEFHPFGNILSPSNIKKKRELVVKVLRNIDIDRQLINIICSFLPSENSPCKRL